MADARETGSQSNNPNLTRREFFQGGVKLAAKGAFAFGALATLEKVLASPTKAATGTETSTAAADKIDTAIASIEGVNVIDPLPVQDTLFVAPKPEITVTPEGVRRKRIEGWYPESKPFYAHEAVARFGSGPENDPTRQIGSWIELVDAHGKVVAVEFDNPDGRTYRMSSWRKDKKKNGRTIKNVDPLIGIATMHDNRMQNGRLIDKTIAVIDSGYNKPFDVLGIRVFRPKDPAKRLPNGSQNIQHLYWLAIEKQRAIAAGKTVEPVCEATRGKYNDNIKLYPKMNIDFVISKFADPNDPATLDRSRYTVEKDSKGKVISVTFNPKDSDPYAHKFKTWFREKVKGKWVTRWVTMDGYNDTTPRNTPGNQVQSKTGIGEGPNAMSWASFKGITFYVAKYAKDDFDLAKTVEIKHIRRESLPENQGGQPGVAHLNIGN